MTKIVAKQAFTTTDGQNFFDLGEANTHQAKLDNAQTIEAFLVKSNIGKAQAGMLRNTLPAFIAFKAEVEGGLDISGYVAKAADSAKADAEVAAGAAATDSANASE